MGAFYQNTDPLSGYYNLGASLFSASGSQNTAQLDYYAKNDLVKALQYYNDGKYSQAITTLKRAVGYNPTSSTAINAYDYIAKSYLQLGETSQAIDTYKKSIQTNPSQDATYVSLANIYYSNQDYGSAVNYYEKAANINPTSPNFYSLGQGYMADGQYNNAMKTFERVKIMAPNQPYGDFGIGQVYAKQGQYQDAISSFQKSIKLAPQYWNAYSEMGYSLADSGQLDAAQAIVNDLQKNKDNNSQALASQLNLYIYGKTKPKISGLTFVNMGTPFLSNLGPGTKVSELGNLNLLTPNDSQTFSISFKFSKPMDQNSVQNVQNWDITRSTGNYLSQDYNYGQPVSNTETLLSRNPTAVYYDPSTLTATVLFSISQNSSVNATIDPSHIQFAFNGKDATGLAMDPKANEYTGFSGIA